MKRVLIVNTVTTGYTGITSVILNFSEYTYKKVEYYFVLASHIEKDILTKVEKYGEVLIPPYSRVKKTIQYMLWLKKVLVKYCIDVVHVHGSSATLFFDLFPAYLANIPIRICHSHSSSTKHSFVHKMLKLPLNNISTIKLACSDKAGKWLFNHDFIILNNGINADDFKYSKRLRAEYRKRLNLENQYIIGHVGYMDIEKNHFYLLRLFKKLYEVDTTTHLLLIGDGRLRGEIEQQIEDLSLTDCVTVLGKRNDVNCLYHAMDLFVLPSLFEGFPVSLLEAQCAGLHCLVSSSVTRQIDLTGNIEFIGIADDDINTWVEHVEAKKTLQDSNRENAYQVIIDSQYSIERCSAKLLEIYDAGGNE